MQRFLSLWIILILLLLCALSVPDTLEAQIVNMQAALSGDIREGAGFAAEFRQEQKGGNTETERLTGQGTLTYKRPVDLWLLVAKRDYSSESGKSSSDSHFEHLRYRYKLTDTWGWEAFLQDDADHFRRSSRRNVVGTGPRYQITPLENLNLALSLAYMHEREKFSQKADLPAEPKRETERLATTLFVSWKWPDCCTLGNTLFYQPSIQSSKNHKTLNEASFLVTLNKYLSYRLSHVYSYNGKPPSSVKKVDVSFLQALVVTLQ